MRLSLKGCHCDKIRTKLRVSSRGLQRDVVYLGWPIVPSCMSPNAGGGGSCGVSANEYSCTPQEPKSNTIFNLWFQEMSLRLCEKKWFWTKKRQMMRFWQEKKEMRIRQIVDTLLRQWDKKRKERRAPERKHLMIGSPETGGGQKWSGWGMGGGGRGRRGGVQMVQCGGDGFSALTSGSSSVFPFSPSCRLYCIFFRIWRVQAGCKHGRRNCKDTNP